MFANEEKKEKGKQPVCFLISKKKELKLKVPRQLFCLYKYFNYRTTEEKTKNNIIMHDYWYMKFHMNIYKRTTTNSKFKGERRDDCLILQKMLSIVCTKQSENSLHSASNELRKPSFVYGNCPIPHRLLPEA